MPLITNLKLPALSAIAQLCRRNAARRYFLPAPLSEASTHIALPSVIR
jgi:hypothetical protein